MFPVFMPVSVCVEQDVEQSHFLGILSDSRLDTMMAFTAWEIRVALSWSKSAKLDSVLYLYFDQSFKIGFLPNCEVPYFDKSRPFRVAVEQEGATYYEAQETSFGTLRVTAVAVRTISRSIIRPSTLAASAQVAV